MKYVSNIPVPDEFDLDQAVGGFDAWLAGKDIEFDATTAAQELDISELGGMSFLIATKGWMEGSPYRANMAMLSALFTIYRESGKKMTAAETRMVNILAAIAHAMRRAEERHELIAFQGGGS